MNLAKEIDKYKFIVSAQELADELNVHVYLVGGFVRDIILNRARNDIDFLVIGDVKLYSQKFANKLGIENVVIYKNFGTA
ncbi:MAG: tRNA nucleotidyltransferase, partial [Ignavibacteriaceae bacterium]